MPSNLSSLGILYNTILMKVITKYAIRVNIPMNPITEPIVSRVAFLSKQIERNKPTGKQRLRTKNTQLNILYPRGSGSWKKAIKVNNNHVIKTKIAIALPATIA